MATTEIDVDRLAQIERAIAAIATNVLQIREDISLIKQDVQAFSELKDALKDSPLASMFGNIGG